MKIEEQLKILEEAFSRYKQLKKELEWWQHSLINVLDNKDLTDTQKIKLIRTKI